MNVLSLFSGIGGLELGLARAGMTVVGQVEIDPFCRRVLATHWPEVPRHDDVRTAVGWWGSQPRPAVDVVAGGFPCQPVSQAGEKLAQEDARWLWPEMASVVAAIRPRWVIAENVPGLLRRGFGDVIADLSALGYDAEWDCVPAAAVGAPHERDRVFIVAYPARVGWGARRTRRPDDEATDRAGLAPEELANTDGAGLEGPRIFRSAPDRLTWDPEPRILRVAHGVPAQVDRLRALGNAIVPPVAEHVGRLIVTADRERVTV